VVVVAQGEAVPVMPETTFGWVLLAWVIYAIASLLANVKRPQKSSTPSNSQEASSS